MAKPTAERRLQKTHISLMRTPQFALYSGLLMVGTSTVDDDFPTAATDGRNKVYGRKFVDDLSDKELAFVVIHECMHVAFRHLTVWKSLFKINPQLTNMACVVEGTRITMADGSLRPVEDVCGGEYVKTPLGGARVLLNTSTVKDDIVELCLHTGHKLVMTADHKVLTNEGFIEAGKITSEHLCAVDTRGNTIPSGQLRHPAEAGYGRETGPYVHAGIGSHDYAQDNPPEEGYAARRTGLECAGQPDANRLGLHSRDYRRGGHDNSSGAYPTGIHNTQTNHGYATYRGCDQHKLAASPVSGEAGPRLGAANQQRRQEVLYDTSIWLGDRSVISWDASVFDSKEAVGRVDVGAFVDTRHNAVQIELFSQNVRDSGAYQGYEYARVTSARRFKAEQRVYDLTTTAQCFEAEGVVTHNCDYVINLLIVEADPNQTIVAMPMRDGKRVGLYDTKYKGMNTKQVFDLLKQEQEQNGGAGQPGDGNGQGDGHGGFDHHDWEGASEMPAEEAKQLEREVEQALRQGAIAAQKAFGKNGSNNLPRELGGLLAPQLDWRDLLREFATSTCSAKDASSWRRVNRRFIGHDLYMPSLIGEKVRKVFVGADASGSTFISPPIFNAFMSETKAICETVNPDVVELVYWDTRITGHEVYENSELAGLVTSTKPKGGGGTDPSCVEAFMEKENIEADCIIVLTDGHVPNWGTNWSAPILWVIAGNPGAQASTGKTIHIND